MNKPLIYKQGLLAMAVIAGAILFPRPLLAEKADANPLDQRQPLQVISQSLRDRAGERYQFTQERQVALLNKPVKSSGVLAISNQHGMCWAISKPYTMTMLIGEQGIFEIDSKGERRLLMPSANPVFETFSRVYLALFRGEVAALQQDFTLQPEVTDQGWNLELVPQSQNSLKWLQQIRFSQRSSELTLELEEKNSDSTVIRFIEEGPDSEPEPHLCW